MNDRIYYAIGDVHGEDDKLARLHDHIREDARRLGAAPFIVHLGDLIDRGPDSRAVVERVMTCAGDSICLKGNHEEMLLNAYESASRNTYATWSLNGGDNALESYERANGAHADWRDSIDPAHLKWLRTLPVMHRAGTLVFVHAGIDPWRFPNCPDELKIWTRSPSFFNARDWPEREELRDIVVIHGHTPTDHYAPDVSPRRINIDTGACFGGPLTCAVLAPGEAPRFLYAR